jgi:hypothetical protein
LDVATQPDRGGLVRIGDFLAGSHEMPAAVARYLPDEPWAFGLVLWLVDALGLLVRASRFQVPKSPLIPSPRSTKH